MANTELDLPKAEASSKEVLETKANKAADATEGPHAQIDPNVYVTWTRPDGSTLVAPLSNSETYERKGFKKGAEQTIESLVAWNQDNASKEAKPAEATPKTTSSKAS